MPVHRMQKASRTFEGLAGALPPDEVNGYETSRLRIRKREATSSDKSTISMHW